MFILTATLVIGITLTSASALEPSELYDRVSKAEEAAKWFSGYYALEEDYTDLSDDGTKIANYMIIGDEALYEQKKAELLTYFSAEMTQKLLDTALNAEKTEKIVFVKNGKLYAHKGMASLFGLAEGDREVTKIVSRTEEKVVFTLTLTLERKTVSGNYVYERVNGQWVFTDYVFPIALYFSANPDTSDASVVCVSAALLSAVGAAFVMKKRGTA